MFEMRQRIEEISREWTLNDELFAARLAILIRINTISWICANVTNLKKSKWYIYNIPLSETSLFWNIIFDNFKI